jgi:myosin heavy subunit
LLLTYTTAATKIQRVYRQFMVKKAFEYRRSMILSVQAGLVSFLAKSRVLLKAFASIETCLCVIAARSQCNRTIRCIRMVQNRFRRRRLRQKFRMVVSRCCQEYTNVLAQEYRNILARSVLRIQSFWRGHISRRRCHGSFTVLRAKVVIV